MATSLPKSKTSLAGPPAAMTQPRPSAAMAHQLLDTPAGELVQKFAPQYLDKIPPDKAKQTFREVLKTSDFMTKSFIMSIVGQHLPKGVTAQDISAAVNEAPPAAAKPVEVPTEAPTEAPAAAAPAAGAATPQPAVQAGAGPAAVAAATAPAAAAPAGAGGRAVITPELMRAIRQIESGGNPRAQTGSYKGLYQLSDAEFKRLGGVGDIFAPKENERIAALKLQHEADQVAKQLGRALTPGEIYLVHQQGVGGAPAHIKNPMQAAWKSMYSTAEGQQKGEKWAKLAIWGNIPDKDKARFGSVENVTSADFAKLWDDQITRRSGGKGSTTAEPQPLDPTPNVGSGQSDYDEAAKVEAAKKMVDPTPNVGSGASDYAAPSLAESVKNADQKTFSAGLGEAFEGLAQAFNSGGAGAGRGSASGSTTVPAAQLPTPPGIQPLVDPRMADMQRQQLALAMQRLNSGKLF